MGIPGLLQGLKSYTQAGNIRDFRGQAIAVDASSWLHKSIYPIAEHYVEATWGNNDDEQQQQQLAPPSVDAHSVQVSTDYMLKRCRELVQHAGIRHVYLVFDGKRCPLKAGTNAERERKRQEHLTEARKYRKLAASAQSQSSHAQKQQQQYREQMFHHYKICIKVTQALADAVADKLQQYCNNNNNNHKSGCPFELVFSPFEADAQLVQLVVAGRAQAVVTEDSDVLVYSAACQYAFPTLFKLDRQSGCCQILSMDFLLGGGSSTSSNNNNKSAAASRKQQQPPRRSALLPMTAAERQELEKKASSSSSSNNSQLENILSCFAERQGRDPGRGSRLFVQACILTGCDYAPNLLQGIGLVTAFKHVRSCMHKSPDERFRQVLKTIPQKAKRGILLQQYSQQQQQPVIMGNTNISSSSSLPPMEAYEELLAKSEAVFYYHPVLDTVARHVTLFTRPNTTNTTSSTRANISSGNNNNNNSSVIGHYRPSLARFQGDWSFLSKNPQDYHDYLQPRSAAHQNGDDDTDDDDDDTQDSWFMRPTTTRPSSSYSATLASSRQPHLATSKPTAPPVNVAAAATRAQPSKNNKPVPPFVVMSNPYRQPNKRPIQENNNSSNNNHYENDNRPEKRIRGGPLEPKSPNLESKKKNATKEQQQQQKGCSSKNLFAKFAAQKNNDKENPPPPADDDDNGGKQHHNYLQNLFDHRNKSDVRFVKPAFDANGNRIVKQPAASSLLFGLPVASSSSSTSQQHEPPPPPPAAASFSSQHAPPPRPPPFDDSAQHQQQQEHDFSTTRQQQPLFMLQSQNSESESNYFSQRTDPRQQQQQQQQQKCSSRSIIHDHDSHIAEQKPPFGLLAGLDEEEEENMSEEFDDASRQWQRQEQASFLEPSSRFNTSLPLVSSEEGFDYEEEPVETFYQPAYFSSTLAAPTASLLFASHGDNEQVNNYAASPRPRFQNDSFRDDVTDDSMTQDHPNNIILASRPLFARDAHSCLPTGLDFEEENQEVDNNFNDLTAPPPFRNPSFRNDGDINNTSHNAFSSQPPMDSEFDGGENEIVADNCVDLTETSCPPFENPTFCADEKEEPTTRHSDYFARPRLGNDFSRRVTLESPTQQPITATTTAGRLQNNPIFQPDLPRPNQFDLYDDFFSPKKAPPNDEDIEDSPPNSGNHHDHHHRLVQRGVSLSLNLYSQRSHQQAPPPPKPKSTIGPVKTLRKRFKSCGTVNTNNNPLAKAFERQRQMAAFEGITNSSSSSSSSARGGTYQASHAHRRRLPNLNQSTLMFSFSSTAHQRK